MASSVLYRRRSSDIFCPKKYVEKINKIPEFCVNFARKIIKIPEFFVIISRKLIQIA